MLILGNKAVALDLVQGVAEIERDVSFGFSEEAVIGSLKNILEGDSLCRKLHFSYLIIHQRHHSIFLVVKITS